MESFQHYSFKTIKLHLNKISDIKESSENTRLTTYSETMSEAVKQKFAELESKNVELEKKVRTLEYQITHMSLDANKEASALEKVCIILLLRKK